MGALVDEAVREYLETASITDVDAGDIAATQMNLMGELGAIPRYDPDETVSGDAAS